VSLADKEATLEFYPGDISADDVRQKIFDMGFDAEIKSDERKSR
jgi:hypothetical protein